MARPQWLKQGQPSPEDPPGAGALDPSEEAHFSNLALRSDLPTHKGAQVALIEEGWRPWLTIVLRGLKESAKPGRRFNRTAVNTFQKALIECGRLADAVAALLRRLGVSSEEELETIVAAYRQAQRAEPRDNVESAILMLEAHFKTDAGRTEHASIGSRLGYSTKGGREDA